MTNNDNIEKFIRKNRYKFNREHPPDNHMDKFLSKLNYRIRHIISIVPHLFKVALVTVFVFTASIIFWNNYMRKDRHEVTLRNKISTVIRKTYSPLHKYPELVNH